jgi:hypothetical protein
MLYSIRSDRLRIEQMGLQLFVSLVCGAQCGRRSWDATAPRGIQGYAAVKKRKRIEECCGCLAKANKHMGTRRGHGEF